MKEIIIPGEKVEDRNYYSYEKEDGYHSMIFGLLSKDDTRSRIVPLKGPYRPREGDMVVGVITDVKYGGCVVDLNMSSSAFLLTKRDYNVADVVMAEITRATDSLLLENEKRLYNGDILDVSPVKVPRIIGKRSSMLNLLKEGTDCLIFVGKNGRIFIKGDNFLKAKKAIKKISKEAHTDGLTDRMTKFLQVN